MSDLYSKSLDTTGRGKVYRFCTIAERASSALAAVHSELRAPILYDENATGPASEDGAWFTHELTNWVELDPTTHFRAVAGKLRPWAGSLALLVHHKAEVVATLCTALRVPDNLAWKAELSLLATLARDLQEELVPQFPEIVRGMLAAIDPSRPEMVGYAFKCLASIFATLAPHLLPHVDDLKPMYGELLGHSKEYVRMFGADSLAFLLRRLRPKPLAKHTASLVKAMRQRHPKDPSSAGPRKPASLQAGISALMFEVVRGPQHGFHSNFATVMPALIKAATPKLGGEQPATLQATLAASRYTVVHAALEACARHASTQHSTEMGAVLCDALDAGVQELLKVCPMRSGSSAAAGKKRGRSAADAAAAAVWAEHVARLCATLCRMCQVGRRKLAVGTLGAPLHSVLKSMVQSPAWAAGSIPGVAVAMARKLVITAWPSFVDAASLAAADTRVSDGSSEDGSDAELDGAESALSADDLRALLRAAATGAAGNCAGLDAVDVDTLALVLPSSSGQADDEASAAAADLAGDAASSGSPTSFLQLLLGVSSPVLDVNSLQHACLARTFLHQMLTAAQHHACPAPHILAQVALPLVVQAASTACTDGAVDDSLSLLLQVGDAVAGVLSHKQLRVDAAGQRLHDSHSLEDLLSRVAGGVVSIEAGKLQLHGDATQLVELCADTISAGAAALPAWSTAQACRVLAACSCAGMMQEEQVSDSALGKAIAGLAQRVLPLAGSTDMQVQPQQVLLLHAAFAAVQALAGTPQLQAAVNSSAAALLQVCKHVVNTTQYWYQPVSLKRLHAACGGDALALHVQRARWAGLCLAALRALEVAWEVALPDSDAAAAACYKLLPLCLSHPERSVRVAATRVALAMPNLRMTQQLAAGERANAEPELSAVPQLMAEVAHLPATVMTQRQKVMRIQQLGALLEGGRLPAQHQAYALHFCLGQLHVKFAPIWAAARAAITQACEHLRVEALPPLLLAALSAHVQRGSLGASAGALLWNLAADSRESGVDPGMTWWQSACAAMSQAPTGSGALLARAGRLVLRGLPATAEALPPVSGFVSGAIHGVEQYTTGRTVVAAVTSAAMYGVGSVDCTDSATLFEQTLGLWKDAAAMLKQRARQVVPLFLTFMAVDYYGVVRADEPDAQELNLPAAVQRLAADAALADDAAPEGEWLYADAGIPDVRKPGELLALLCDDASIARELQAVHMPSSLSITPVYFALPAAQSTKRLLAWLGMLEQWKGWAKVLAWPLVKHTLVRLLVKADGGVAAAALRVLTRFKLGWLSPYKDHLLALATESHFRDVLAKLVAVSKNGEVLDEHRHELMPVLLRLLFGKLIQRGGRARKQAPAARRAAILGWCTTLEPQEVAMLVHLALRTVTINLPSGSLGDWEPACAPLLKQLQATPCSTAFFCPPLVLKAGTWQPDDSATHAPANAVDALLSRLYCTGHVTDSMMDPERLESFSALVQLVQPGLLALSPARAQALLSLIGAMIKQLGYGLRLYIPLLLAVIAALYARAAGTGSAASAEHVDNDAALDDEAAARDADASDDEVSEDEEEEGPASAAVAAAAAAAASSGAVLARRSGKSELTADRAKTLRSACIDRIAEAMRQYGDVPFAPLLVELAPLLAPRVQALPGTVHASARPPALLKLIEVMSSRPGLAPLLACDTALAGAVPCVLACLAHGLQLPPGERALPGVAISGRTASVPVLATVFNVVENLLALDELPAPPEELGAEGCLLPVDTLAEDEWSESTTALRAARVYLTWQRALGYPSHAGLLVPHMGLLLQQFALRMAAQPVAAVALLAPSAQGDQSHAVPNTAPIEAKANAHEERRQRATAQKFAYRELEVLYGVAKYAVAAISTESSAATRVSKTDAVEAASSLTPLLIPRLLPSRADADRARFSASNELTASDKRRSKVMAVLQQLTPLLTQDAVAPHLPALSGLLAPGSVPAAGALRETAIGLWRTWTELCGGEAAVEPASWVSKLSASSSSRIGELDYDTVLDAIKAVRELGPAWSKHGQLQALPAALHQLLWLMSCSDMGTRAAASDAARALLQPACDAIVRAQGKSVQLAWVPYFAACALPGKPAQAVNAAARAIALLLEVVLPGIRACLTTDAVTVRKGFLALLLDVLGWLQAGISEHAVLDVALFTGAPSSLACVSHAQELLQRWQEQTTPLAIGPLTRFDCPILPLDMEAGDEPGLAVPLRVALHLDVLALRAPTAAAATGSHAPGDEAAAQETQPALTSLCTVEHASRLRAVRRLAKADVSSLSPLSLRYVLLPLLLRAPLDYYGSGVKKGQFNSAKRIFEQVTAAVSNVVRHLPWGLYSDVVTTIQRLIDAASSAHLEKAWISTLAAVLAEFPFKTSDVVPSEYGAVIAGTGQSKKIKMPVFRGTGEAALQAATAEGEGAGGSGDEADTASVSSEDSAPPAPGAEPSGRHQWTSRIARLSAGYLLADVDAEHITLLLLQRVLPKLQKLYQVKRAGRAQATGMSTQIQTSAAPVAPGKAIAAAAASRRSGGVAGAGAVAARPHMAIPIIKCLFLLPDAVFNVEIPKLMMRLTAGLKSRKQDERDAMRAVLVTAALELGGEHMQYVVTSLRRSLTEGYQLHVLGYTVHAVLVGYSEAGVLVPTPEELQASHAAASAGKQSALARARSVAERAMADADLTELPLVSQALVRSLPALIDVVLDDVLGHVAAAREDENYRPRTDLLEAKVCRSYSTYQLLASVIPWLPHGAIHAMLTPLLRELRAHAGQARVDKVVSDLLQRGVTGLTENPWVKAAPESIAVYMYCLVRDNIMVKGVATQAALDEALQNSLDALTAAADADAERLEPAPDAAEDESGDAVAALLSSARVQAQKSGVAARRKRRRALGEVHTQSVTDTYQAYRSVLASNALTAAALAAHGAAGASVSSSRLNALLGETTAEGAATSGPAAGSTAAATQQRGIVHMAGITSKPSSTFKVLPEAKLTGVGRKAWQPGGPGAAAGSGGGMAQSAATLVWFALCLMHGSLKRGLLDVSQKHVVRLLDPHIALLTAVLTAARSARVRQLALQLISRMLVHAKQLPSAPARAPELGRALVAQLRATSGATKKRGRNELASAALRATVSALRYLPSLKLTPEQAEALVAIARVDLMVPDRQASTFALLMALVSKRVLTPAVYDVMNDVARLLITALRPSARAKASRVFVLFLTRYPLGEDLLRRHLAFFLNNLAYKHPDGRLAVADVLHAVVSKFPKQALALEANTLFLPLAQRLGLDPAPTPRAAVGLVIQELAKRVPDTEAHSFATASQQWLGAPKPALQAVGAQLLGLLAEARGSMFASRETDIAGALLSLLSAGVAQAQELQQRIAASMGGLSAAGMAQDHSAAVRRAIASIGGGSAAADVDQADDAGLSLEPVSVAARAAQHYMEMLATPKPDEALDSDDETGASASEGDEDAEDAGVAQSSSDEDACSSAAGSDEDGMPESEASDAGGAWAWQGVAGVKRRRDVDEGAAGSSAGEDDSVVHTRRGRMRRVWVPAGVGGGGGMHLVPVESDEDSDADATMEEQARSAVQAAVSQMPWQPVYHALCALQKVAASNWDVVAQELSGAAPRPARGRKGSKQATAAAAFNVPATVAACLVYPHVWVRNAALRWLDAQWQQPGVDVHAEHLPRCAGPQFEGDAAAVLQSPDLCGLKLSADESQPGIAWLRRGEAAFAVARNLATLTQPNAVSPAEHECLIRCLVFIAMFLHRTSPLAQRNMVPEWCTEQLDGEVATAVHAQPDTAADARDPVFWLWQRVTNAGMAASGDILLVTLKWAGAMAASMEPAELCRYMAPLARFVHRITVRAEGEAQRVHASAIIIEAGTIAAAVGDVVAHRVGSLAWAAALSRERAARDAMRERAAAARAVEAVVNPKAAAQRKAAKSQTKRVARQKRNARFKERRLGLA